MVRAIGTDLETVENSLTRKLLEANFVPKKIKLSAEIGKQALIQELVQGQSNEYERYDGLMTAGDLLRSCSGRPDAAAILAMEAIRVERPKLRAVLVERKCRGIAFILSSLMHPAEVRALRDAYGSRVFVISAYSHTESRRRRLRDSLTPAAVDLNRDLNELVDNLMARDRGRGYDSDALLSRVIDIAEHKILSIDKTFDLADYFVDADSPPEQIDSDAERLLSLVLSSPQHTPTKVEMGMAHAYSARLRSSDLSRQVGAAICDNEGNVLVTGTNEVPKWGGGQYWVDDDLPVTRDIELRYDTSDRMRRQIFADLVGRMFSDPSWLLDAVDAGTTADSNESEGVTADVNPDSEAAESPRRSGREQIEELLSRADLEVAIDGALSTTTVRGAQLFDVVEYGRAAHAEMAAICSAALRGVSIKDSTLYCTTFPCHVCAALIVAAGVVRVVYIEPYPKSRAPEMFPDSIALAHQEESTDGRVVFAPFMGVAPPRHADLFSWSPKKLDDLQPKVEKVLTGDIQEWSLKSGAVRHTLRMGRGDLADDQQAAVENHEKFLIDDFSEQLSSVEDRYISRIRQYRRTTG